MKNDWLKWSTVKEEKGVMVAASKEQEWLLPWWWQNYSYHNSYPVIFVDFGMSSKAKEWCQARGQFMPLPKLPKSFVVSEDEIDQELLKKWKKFYKKTLSFYLSNRKYLFKKPLALLNTIFEKTIWIDLDCAVRDTLKPIFDLPIKTSICCIKTPAHVQTGYYQAGLQKKDEKLYNSGVVFYKHKTPLLKKWAEATLDKNCFFCVDDMLLSNIIYQEKAPLLELPLIYNWFYTWGENPEAKIVHYLNPRGKRCIKKMMKNLSQLTWLQTDYSF